MLTVTEQDLQEISKKYYGDYLTEKELDRARSMLTPATSLANIDDGGYEGILGHIVEAISMAIMLARGDRRHD